MRRFFTMIFCSALGTSTAAVTWMISFFGYDTALLMSGIYAAAGGGTSYLLSKEIILFRFLRRNELTRKEYKYIQQNLIEAKAKIKRLQSTLSSIRNMRQAKEYINILVTVRKIYANTKKDPKRFFKAEEFYYKHLDSLVTLMEKYAYLNSQPARSKDINQSLKETSKTITQLNTTIQNDLHVMLRDDINTLHFELDFANQSLEHTSKKESEAIK